MSKVVLDTCGWLAYFADEPHADKFAPYIEEEGRILVPAVVEYEVHRWALREVGEDKADEYAAAISRPEAVPLTAALARRAAELGHVHKIAACDALVYATAEALGVALVTADPDLQGLPGVEFHEKPGASGRRRRRSAGRRGRSATRNRGPPRGPVVRREHPRDKWTGGPFRPRAHDGQIGPPVKTSYCPLHSDRPSAGEAAGRPTRS